ncbi:MAG: hypothetical protein KDK41_08270 [Leptospiraceae bacterium]|nr:hypothetical protein [Leptospiraceae bacterium]
MKKVLLLVCCSLVFISCAYKEYKISAENNVAEFYRLYTAGELEKLMDLVGDTGLQKDSRERWLGLFRYNFVKRGKAVEFEQTDWNFNTNTESGNTITLDYKTRYENGEFNEKFVFHSSKNPQDVKLIGYDSGNLPEPKEPVEEKPAAKSKKPE